MKNLFFISLILSTCFLASAQKSMYLYFETEDNSPFYLKIDEKVYTSVAPGYYILSGLSEGKQKISIGLPSETGSENKFEIDLRERDLGLIIKKGNGGLVLESMNDGSRINFIKDPTQPQVVYEPRNDAFTLLLSKSSGDPSLLMMPVFAKAEPVIEKPADPVQTVAQKEEVKEPVKQESTASASIAATPVNKDTVVAVVPEKLPEPTKEVKKEVETDMAIRTDSTINKNEAQLESAKVEIEKPADKAEIKPETIPEVVTEPVFKRTSVQKFAESSTSEGFNLVFVDDPTGENDTIRIQIPNPKYNLVNDRIEKELVVNIQKDPKIQDTVAGKAEASPSTMKVDKPVDPIKPETKDSVVIQSATVIESPKQQAYPKNNCKNLASDNDFFKIRKNMASKITDEEMVMEAKKIFRSRCFTTGQIRNLSSLFLTSAGKYLFFDASFTFVSDQELFSELENEIKDDYYKKRFRALIGL